MNWEEKKSLRGQYVTEDSLISLIVKETNKDLAAINDSRVRVRSEPNLKCETLDYVNKGDSVKILDRSTDKQQIGDMNDYWYNVELQNGTKGWVYGAYIDSL
ncbi:SH3 domain-containing protein [Treponema brennaborense]|uniref:SH3 type 3 domain protein n=1 Tax=Treponema brennaborense (strain DSM 12168 / CIP 105900 / DD5/3) TaxID=906968 RepID=F4LJX5_TREBD|nr:SH3 domain-containing protein [Treponema brennaborense]AEE16455.1 SH3 type 3 domain protein [Treponema brennaborense DSM 12168]